MLRGGGLSVSFSNREVRCSISIFHNAWWGVLPFFFFKFLGFSHIFYFRGRINSETRMNNYPISQCFFEFCA